MTEPATTADLKLIAAEIILLFVFAKALRRDWSGVRTILPYTSIAEASASGVNVRSVWLRPGANQHKP